MVEEFLSLLKKEKEKVYEVLRPQIDPSVLKYLVGGFFNEDQKRMMAFALMPVNKDYFWKYDYLLDFSGGHSSIFFKSRSEKSSSPMTPDIKMGIPTGKSLEQMIGDGEYNYNLISFHSEYDFDEWNIMISNCFTNSKDRSRILKSELDRLNGGLKDHFFNSSIFEETGEHYEKMYLRAIKYLEERDIPGSLDGKFEMRIPADLKPFIGHSHLVALIRGERKQVVNQAYITYSQKAIYEPLLIKLKTFYPEEYQHTKDFHIYPCSMLFPDHKRYCLFICLVVDKTKKTYLKFFFYLQENNKIYEWTYFPPSIYKDHKVNVFTIHKIFEPISQLDDHSYLTDPRCTLDDGDFWNNYVLKKDNGKYVYLKELQF